MVTDRRWFWFLILVVVLLVVCVAFWRTTVSHPFAYDEADYMYAGTRGFWANYTDQNAMSLIGFVRKGYELSRDKSQRASMSQYVRSIEDISFYRHYHGPLYAYWIGLGQAIGIRSEAGYRASGLVLHAMGAIAIFWFSLVVFPGMPAPGAFVAAAAFTLNRTALVTATSITQHVAFELTCLVTLFAAAQYVRTRGPHWWNATTAALACSFAAVEISIVLIGAILLSVAATHWEDGPRVLLRRIFNGAGVFLITLTIVWPFGVLNLNAAKGYLYLAYMAVSRKTFTPIGPLDLWTFKIKTYPFEFLPALGALIFAILVWRKLQHRAAATPWVVYTLLFLGATMVITLPYTYYHASLLASSCVLAGIVYGEWWTRNGAAMRLVVLAAILVTLGVSATTYYRETERRPEAPQLAAGVLRLAAQQPSTALLVPFEVVPTLHYYYPSVRTVGYDTDWTTERLAAEAIDAAPSRVVCSAGLCEALEAQWRRETPRTKEILVQSEQQAQTFYWISVGRP